VNQGAELFELELPLPDANLEQLAGRLIGFEARYQRLGRALEILLDPAGVAAWAKKHHGKTWRSSAF
jgi:hypothetical protein